MTHTAITPEMVLTIAATQWGHLAPQPADILRALNAANYKIVPVDYVPPLAAKGLIDPVATINEICERRGITPTELARSVGLAPSSINRNVYKNGGYTGTMGVRTLNKIIAWDNAQP